MGKGDTVGKIVERILKIMGKENLPIVHDPARIRPVKSEVMELISDNSIARKVCGWEPKYSLDDALKETIEWIRKNIDLFRPDEYMI